MRFILSILLCTFFCSFTLAQRPTKPKVRPGQHIKKPVNNDIRQVGSITIESTGDKVSIIAGATQVIVNADGTISITGNGNIDIQAEGALNLSGEEVNIAAEKEVSLKAGSDMVLETDANMEIEAKASLDVHSSATLEIECSAITQINGSLIQLNGGGSPASYLGAKVVNGTVIEGSPTVLIGN